MIRRVVQDLITQLRQAGIRDERLLQAMAAVPRENFVDEALTHKAYDNTALPIGYGQTISQPFMVAKMTELLDPAPQAHVLEIGTGSGYQTAILAHLAAHVYSVERVKDCSGMPNAALNSLICIIFPLVTVTAGKAGRPAVRLTALLSPPPPVISRRRCSVSWRITAGW